MNAWSVSAMGRRNQVWREGLGSAVGEGTEPAHGGERHGTLSGVRGFNDTAAIDAAARTNLRMFPPRMMVAERAHAPPPTLYASRTNTEKPAGTPLPL